MQSHIAIPNYDSHPDSSHSHRGQRPCPRPSVLILRQSWKMANTTNASASSNLRRLPPACAAVASHGTASTGSAMTRIPPRTRNAARAIAHQSGCPRVSSSDRRIARKRLPLGTRDRAGALELLEPLEPSQPPAASAISSPSILGVPARTSASSRMARSASRNGGVSANGRCRSQWSTW